MFKENLKKTKKPVEKITGEISKDSRGGLEDYIKKSLSMGYSIKSVKAALIVSDLDKAFVSKIIKDYLGKKGYPKGKA